jgi:hypothetical protein
MCTTAGGCAGATHLLADLGELPDLLACPA